MANEGTHAALILAAGGSRRLGRSKVLLKRDGEALLQRVVRLAAASGAAPIVVVLGADPMTLRALLAARRRDFDRRLEIIENPDWAEGLASSLRCGAQALAAHRGPCLVLGCDQAALELVHLVALLEGAAHSRSGCAATCHDAMLGLPAVVTPALLAQAHALHGDRGLRDALSRIARTDVGTLLAPELGFDIDTPVDLGQARARGLIDPEIE
jgi:molybdenum cofactor cytidylyltransferase